LAVARPEVPERHAALDPRQGFPRERRNPGVALRQRAAPGRELARDAEDHRRGSREAGEGPDARQRNDSRRAGRGAAERDLRDPHDLRRERHADPERDLEHELPGRGPDRPRGHEAEADAKAEAEGRSLDSGPAGADRRRRYDDADSALEIALESHSGTRVAR